MSGLKLEERIKGAIIGGAVGDAFGAPMECITFKDNKRLLGHINIFKDFTQELLQELNKFRTWEINEAGLVTDDTVIQDLLLDCIIKNDGDITAYHFAREWENFEKPIYNPDGEPVIRLNCVHWIEKIPYYRNQLREINKRHLGQGEANATNAIMYSLPVGLLCAGDPLEAELTAIDITSVNQHHRSRDAAGGYCATIAACFIPGIKIDEIIEIAITHTRDYLYTKELNAILELAAKCSSCDKFSERYWGELIGKIFPYQDLQHDGTSIVNSWKSSEVLGTALAALLISKGDARKMVMACAINGRDADTAARVAGGLAGAYAGYEAIPAEWIEYVLNKNKWLQLEEKSDRLVAVVKNRLKRKVDMCQSLLEK